MIKPSELQTGDTLAYKEGNSLLSRLIQWGTNSQYSHVLKYLGTKEEVLSQLDSYHKAGCKQASNLMIKIKGNGAQHWIIESDFTTSKTFSYILGKERSGVLIKTLEELNNRSGYHDVYRIKNNFNKTLFIQSSIEMFLENYKYDFLGLVWQAILAAKFKFLSFKPFGWTLHNAHKMYCSEMNHWLDILVGLGKENMLPSETNPENYVRKSSQEYIGELAK